jgi:hypothetical protein
VVSFTPRPLYPRERAPGTHWIGGWVGPRAVLDAVVNRNIPSPRRETNPRTRIAQPVAQRCTNFTQSNGMPILARAVRLNATGPFPFPAVGYSDQDFPWYSLGLRSTLKSARPLPFPSFIIDHLQRFFHSKL